MEAMETRPRPTYFSEVEHITFLDLKLFQGISTDFNNFKRYEGTSKMSKALKDFKLF